MTAHVRSWRNGAKESRAVTISIDHADAGEHRGSILITTRQAGDGAGGLDIGAGVKVPVSFVVEDSTSWKVVVVAGLLLVVAVAAVIRKRRMKV